MLHIETYRNIFKNTAGSIGQKIAIFLIIFPMLSYAKEKKVLVEKPIVYKKNVKGKYVLEGARYREMRQKWGFRFNVSTSNIAVTPNEFEADGTPIQIDIGINRNFQYFSVGPELGYMTADFQGGGEVEMTAFNVGVGVYLDGLFHEPYVVPFFSAGVASIDATVLQDGERLDIETDSEYTPYYRLGLLLGLGWLDQKTTVEGRKEIGLQNVFLYVALRKITSTSDNPQIDLESTQYLEYGLQFEF